MTVGLKSAIHVENELCFTVTNSPRFVVSMGWLCVVYVRRKTKHDLTVRDRLTCISNALSLSRS